MIQRETIIKNIKDVRQSSIDGAENIAADYKYPRGSIITCYVDERDEAPYNSVDTSFIPENMRSDCYFDECKDCINMKYNNSLMCCLISRLSLAFHRLLVEIPIVNKFVDNYKYCYSFIADKEQIMYIEDTHNENREFEVKAQLEEERKNIKCFDDLIAFLQRVKDNCNAGYGTAPRAIAQATLATARYLSSDFGITNFQAGFVMWDFVRDWQYPNNECGMKIVDYDNMLYPQYNYQFEKTIPKNSFEALQEKAKKLL